MSFDMKNFLHRWCEKEGTNPYFSVRSVGRASALRFVCEVRIVGHQYVGIGNSTSKEDAELNATRDFVSYLVRQGKLAESAIPADVRAQSNDITPLAPGFSLVSSKPIPKPSERVETEQANHSAGATGGAGASRKTDSKNMDPDAALHGNWTIDRAKSRLHEYLHAHSLPQGYKYDLKIVDANKKAFFCEMEMYVEEIGRSLHARESANKKILASRLCALSLVRQLYHLGVVEAFDPTRKNRIPTIAVKITYDVALDPDMIKRITELLKIYDIMPQKIDTNESNTECISLLNNLSSKEFVTTKSQNANVIQWSPPVLNWNAWSECNIDEGPLAFASLDDVSVDLERNAKALLKSDMKLQKSLKDREKLPIVKMKAKIIEAIADNSVTVIRGSCGCGKTTQVCQFILDEYINAGKGGHCNILVIQPSRTLAASIADRIAAERCEELGNSVGYDVRFESVFPRPYGSILLCTVDELLRKLENGLRGVSHVIVDEVHLRNLGTDFILIILKDLVQSFPDLRVILLSATIDTTLFAHYFNNCPVIEIPVISHIVTAYFLEDIVQMLDFEPSPPNSKKYRSIMPDDEIADGTSETKNMNKIVSDKYSAETKRRMAMIPEKGFCFELVEAILKYIKCKEMSGAVMIFLPGWNLIVSLLRHLNAHPIFAESPYHFPCKLSKEAYTFLSNQQRIKKCVVGSRATNLPFQNRGTDYVILPLHTGLSREEERKVFDKAPSYATKVIIAMDVAETSITVNDVAYVIDLCRTKRKLFNSYIGTINYVTVWASKTKLHQRRGCAGRVREGLCFHLISKARYEKLDEDTAPEMLTSCLHEIALAVKWLRLGSVHQFLSKAIDVPPVEAINHAKNMLIDFKILDSKGEELTAIGRIVAKLPIEPYLGRSIILGTLFKLGDSCATIGAFCSIPPEFFSSDQYIALEQKSFAGNRYSDHIAMLNAFSQYSREAKRGENAEKNFCESNNLPLPMMRIVADAKKQIQDILLMCGFSEECFTEMSHDFTGGDSNLDIMAGLLTMALSPQYFYHKDKRVVMAYGPRRAFIHFSSVICSRDWKFPSPFFVFSKKLRSRESCCRLLTMITPVHLLLFGCRKIDYAASQISLDEWINLNMDPNAAAVIIAFRSVVENFIERISAEPEKAVDLSRSHQNILNIIRQLCSFNAGRFGMDKIVLTMPKITDSKMVDNEQPNEEKTAAESTDPKPAKIMKIDSSNNKNRKCSSNDEKLGRKTSYSNHAESLQWRSRTKQQISNSSQGESSRWRRADHEQLWSSSSHKREKKTSDSNHGESSPWRSHTNQERSWNFPSRDREEQTSHSNHGVSSQWRSHTNHERPWSFSSREREEQTSNSNLGESSQWRSRTNHERPWSYRNREREQQPTYSRGEEDSSASRARSKRWNESAENNNSYEGSMTSSLVDTLLNYMNSQSGRSTSTFDRVEQNNNTPNPPWTRDRRRL